MSGVYVDGEGALRDWINAQPALVGPVGPIESGAHLKRLTSGRAYAYIVGVGTSDGVTAESPIAISRLSVTVYAPRKDRAEEGARAYGNALQALRSGARPTPMGDLAICLTVDNISGPLPVDDSETTREQYRYLVDADFYLLPPA